MVSDARPSRPAGPRGVYAKTPQRQREIVEAAAAVFAARGYSGGSLRQIAKDIGVSVTSVMHHFSSKELLLEAVLDHADAEGIREIDLDAARDGLRTTIVRLAENGQGHPHLLRLLAVLSSEASAAEHSAHEWFVERYELVVNAMTDWIAADETLDLAPDAARVLARRIVALWDGLQPQWLLRSDFDLVAELDAGVAALADQARRTEPPH
jgi:AcrR family transcriptional regulator